MKKYLILLSLFAVTKLAISQRVYSLLPNVSVDSILSAKPNATKIAMDEVSGHLFYSTVNGDIHEVYMPTSLPATDTLRYTATDHGITYLQGLYFKDSVVYLCGNNWSSTTAVGKVVKGKLQSNGTRLWTSILTTATYPSANSWGDHGFAGITIDPTGNYIYVSSGARTHLGEIRTNGGVWPNYREVPLTTRIFKIPINSVGITLANDSTIVDNSGYVFAWGTRNAYDMAWDANGNLFAIDNSGERDDAEELNWLRQGRHYGFPWRMGSNNNPLRVSPYDVNNDPLVNHLCGGYLSGWFNDDPTFPLVPSGVTFTDPIRNYGLVADFYRDPITGKVKNASDEGTYITSFTPHRSPLGLVIDKDSMLAAPFRGDGFVLNFMPGGDSTGYSPISPWGSPGPFVDPARELVQLKLVYNSGIDNYTMTTSNVVEGFYLPVDAELVRNTMYVIENGGDIWKVTFPEYASIPEIQLTSTLMVYPNPSNKSLTIKFENDTKSKHTLVILNSLGEKVRVINDITSNSITIDELNLSKGIYFIQLKSEDKIKATTKILID